MLDMVRSYSGDSRRHRGRPERNRQMPRKIRQLKANLRKAGASIVRQKGSHTTWQHPLIPGILIELAGNDSDDAHPYQERDVRDALRRVAEVQEGDQA